jgi:hypothetical protein
MTALEGAEDVAGYRWLYGKLQSASVGASVYSGEAPRGAATPYVIIQSWPRPDGNDVTAFGGARILARLRYLVKVVSDSLAATEPIAKAIDAALRQDPDAPTEQQSGYSILNPRRVSPFEMPTVEGDELYWQVGGYYDLEVAAGV